MDWRDAFLNKNNSFQAFTRPLGGLLKCNIFPFKHTSPDRQRCVILLNFFTFVVINFGVINERVKKAQRVTCSRLQEQGLAWNQSANWSKFSARFTPLVLLVLRSVWFHSWIAHCERVGLYPRVTLPWDPLRHFTAFGVTIRKEKKTLRAVDWVLILQQSHYK